jgi:hypothetical protein
MTAQTFAKKLEIHSNKKLLDAKNSNIMPSHGRSPPSLYRYLGNQAMNQLMEATQNKEKQRQDHLDNQGTNPKDNLNELMPVLKKQYDVSEPDDPVEQEATSVASQIINMEEPSADSNAQMEVNNDMGVWRSPIIARKQEPNQDAHSAVDIDLPTSNGQPLDKSLAAYMEPRFGYSFDNVRIHTSSQSADLSAALNARAFTVGRDIYFGHGEYSPQTIEGKKLMAHELTHVIQQRQNSKLDKSIINRNKIPKPQGTEPTTGGLTGLSLDVTFNVSNTPAAGLQAIQTVWCTGGPQKVGKMTIPEGSKTFDAFVDGGKNSPFVTISGNPPAHPTMPYYLTATEVSNQVKFTKDSGTIQITDVPGAALAWEEVHFETAVVAINYNASGNDKVLKVFDWGFTGKGKKSDVDKGTKIAGKDSGINVKSSVSSRFTSIVKNDYPTYTFT